jgi:hypothetical protein
MRLRLTILTLLAVGALMGAADAGLAAQGLGHSDNASQGQYGPPVGVPNQPELPPMIGPVKPPPGEGETSAGGQAARPVEVGGPPLVQVQETRQVEAGSASLAHTGFDAIPFVLLGVGLVAIGLAVRRKAPRED